MNYLDPRNELPAFMLKDHSEFSEQKEIRAVWRPISTDKIAPLNVSYNGLSSYVEAHKYLQDTT